MNPDTRSAKQILRRQVIAVLETMTEPEQAAESAGARALMAVQALWQESRSVLFYAPMPGELDVWPLLVEGLAAGKSVALPQFDRRAGTYVACEVRHLARDLTAGHFGIREPAGHCKRIALNRLDLILVPGVAFDLHGHRLGRGKGYYDQLLAGLRAARCGVAFDRQIVDEVPVGAHDIDINCLLTPTRWVGF